MNNFMNISKEKMKNVKTLANNIALGVCDGAFAYTYGIFLKSKNDVITINDLKYVFSEKENFDLLEPTEKILDDVCHSLNKFTEISDLLKSNIEKAIKEDYEHVQSVFDNRLYIGNTIKDDISLISNIIAISIYHKQDINKIMLRLCFSEESFRNNIFKLAILLMTSSKQFFEELLPIVKEKKDSGEWED